MKKDKEKTIDHTWFSKVNELIGAACQYYKLSTGLEDKVKTQQFLEECGRSRSAPLPKASADTRQSPNSNGPSNRCSLVLDSTSSALFEAGTLKNVIEEAKGTQIETKVESSGIGLFINACLENTTKWQSEVGERIESAFEISLSDCNVDIEPNCNQSTKHKCSFLFQIVAISIPDYGFDARTARVLDELCITLKIPKEEYMKRVESQLAEQLKKGYLREQQDLNAQSTAGDRLKKKIMVGFGAVAGGLALAVTAGMAAPVVLSICATLLGAAYVAGVTATTLFIVIFGLGGAGLTKYKVERRYEDVKDFTFVPIIEAEQMRVAIGISGWIREDDDVTRPWHQLASPGVDVYALQCHVEAFTDLGNALRNFVASTVVNYAAMEVIKTTALSAAVAALMWPATVLQVGRLIDNPWSRCSNIAEKEGIILADAIRKHAHGHRPVLAVFMYASSSWCRIGDPLWIFPGSSDNLHLSFKAI